MLISLTLIGFTAAFGLYCHCQWAKTHKMLEAYDVLLRNGWRHALITGGWIHPLMKDRQWNVYSTQEALEVTAKSTWAMREITEAERNQSATYREEQLAFKVKKLQRELRGQQEAAREKNIALDALYYVWCSGGCKGGTRRWLPKDVSEETVVAEFRPLRRDSLCPAGATLVSTMPAPSGFCREAGCENILHNGKHHS